MVNQTPIHQRSPTVTNKQSPIPQGSEPQTTALHISMERKRAFFSAPARPNLGTLSQHECGIFAQGQRSDPQKDPESEFFQDREKKRKDVHTAPSRIGSGIGGRVNDILLKGWVKGGEEARLFLGYCSQAASGSVACGQWLITCHSEPVHMRLDLSMHGVDGNPKTLVSFIYFFLTNSLCLWASTSSREARCVLYLW
jgi:hypothetical protein